MSDAADELSDAECRRLLGTHTLGRVGITSGGLPHILPVCYFYDDDSIVFRTGRGTKLRAASSGDVIVFQIDSYDLPSGQGWTVQVLGRASVITTEHEHDGLPTLDGEGDDDECNHYISLHCDLITGQVIGASRSL